MNTIFRLLAFRALAPDEGAGGGTGAPAAEAAGGAEGAVDFSALSDAAYDAATGSAEEADEGEGEGEGGKDEGTERAGNDAPEGTDAVADAAEGPEDGVDPEAAPEAVPEAGAIPAEVAERYPAVGDFLAFDAGIQDPARAPGVLRRFAEAVAAHHGTDVATMLGLAPARDDAGRFAARPAEEGGLLSAPKGWQAAGFATPAEYDAAPDFERAGFLSQGEYALARRLDALQAQVAPTLRERSQARAEAAERAASEAKQARYEARVTELAPATIARVRAATGWAPTAAQVMEAARQYPQVARRSLAEAVQAAFVREILAGGGKAGPKDGPRLDDLPTGGPRQGTRGYEPSEDGSMNWNRLADAAYETAVAG